MADLLGKPEEKINGRMTGALTIYSATFMRYAWSPLPISFNIAVILMTVVTPRNYLLFLCHVINETAQLGQGYRYLNYWQYSPKFCMIENSFGGREKKLAQLPPDGEKAESESPKHVVAPDVPPKVSA